MRCDKVMKRDVQALRPEDDIALAARTMRDTGVGFLPVIDPLGRVLGTLTDRDIAIRVCAEERPCSTPVAEVYTRDCVAVRPEDDVGVAREVMGHYRKSRILVTDPDCRLVGVISLSDLARIDPGTNRTLREVTRRERRPPAPPDKAPWKAER